MISRPPLRPSASLFKHGVCIFCQNSKSPLVRGARPAPSTQARDNAREPYYKARSAEEIVARQLGRTYIGKKEKSRPRIPPEILMQAYKAGRMRIEVRTAEYIMQEFEPIMKKPSAASTLATMCTSKYFEISWLTLID